MNKLLAIPVLFALLMNCVKNNHKEVQRAVEPKQDVPARVKPPSTFQDIVTVREACALFYEPDSLQLKKIKMITQPRIFDATMHDFFFMSRYAHTFLRQHMKRLKIINLKHARVVFFIKQNGAFEVVDIDTLGDAYGLILFDRVKNPLQIDMSNVETQAQNYFERL